VRPDDAAILPIALLADEFLCFETREEPGDVRFRGDHHAANGGAGEAGLAGSAEDAEDVVLGGGEAERLEALLKGAMEEVSRTHQGEEGLLLGTGEAEGLLDSR